MRERVLTLDPLAFGVAGGKLAGTVTLDGSKEPIAARVDMRVKDVSLPKLFPTVDKAQSSIGDVNGLIELEGRGDSVAAMLGSADGKLGVFIDGGRVSKFLMELAALDLWGVAKTKLAGDKPVPIRCAIGDFAVKDGVMHTNALVFDTDVVNVQGSGQINLKSEAMDLKLKPEPKGSSIASLNSPLYVRGTFGEPKVAPDAGKLAAKGLGALVMSAINPLLAVLTFGEGWHNNHHHYQRSARQGFYWWEIDITYYGLKLLEKLRIVHDVQGVPRHVRDREQVAPALGAVAAAIVVPPPE